MPLNPAVEATSTRFLKPVFAKVPAQSTLSEAEPLSLEENSQGPLTTPPLETIALQALPAEQHDQPLADGSPTRLQL